MLGLDFRVGAGIIRVQVRDPGSLGHGGARMSVRVIHCVINNRKTVVFSRGTILRYSGTTRPRPQIQRDARTAEAPGEDGRPALFEPQGKRHYGGCERGWV